MGLEHKVKNLEAKCAKKVPPSSLPQKPVSPLVFLEGKKFMNARGVLYPEVQKAYLDLNEGNYTEAVLTGAIGVGKTTLAIYSLAYQFYLLCCMGNPQRAFGMDPASEIVILFQSVTARLAETVDFRRFKEMVLNASCFKFLGPPVSSTSNEIRFRNQVVIRAGCGLPTAALGQNVFSGLIDEANFMAVQDRSLRANDGGEYDQASDIYESISRRRKSRFMRKGKVPGILCIASSRRYPNEFTERLEKVARAEKRRTGESSIYVYDKRLWEVKPQGTYSKKRFKVFYGDMSRDPCVLGVGCDPNQLDEQLVMDIPEDFRNDFEMDIHSALRDIAGVATSVIHPFIPNKAAIAKVFGTHLSILSLDKSDLTETEPIVDKEQLKRLGNPRWVHLDLAFSADSAGIACGHVPGFVKMDRGDGTFETLPRIVIDFVLEVPPPRGGEINFEKIRNLIYKVFAHGVPIKWISMDSYQSKDTQQILRHKGFAVGEDGPDKKSIMYDVLKSAIHDGRVYLPDHNKAQRELIELERDAKTDKVDHPPTGSKDLADSIAAVVYGLTWRTENWTRHGISTQEFKLKIRDGSKNNREEN